MAAPFASGPSKGYYVDLLALINQLVSDGVVTGATTVTNTLIAVQAEIDAR